MERFDISRRFIEQNPDVKRYKAMIEKDKIYSSQEENDFKKSMEDLIIKNKGAIQVVTNKPKRQRKAKKIKDFLLCENKDEVAQWMRKQLYKETSGKKAAIIKAALVLKNYLIKGAPITPTLISEFSMQCSRQAINDYTPKTEETKAMACLMP